MLYPAHEKLLRLLGRARVALSHLLKEAGQLLISRGVTDVCVYRVRALEGVVKNADEVVVRVAGSGVSHGSSCWSATSGSSRTRGSGERDALPVQINRCRPA